MARKLTGLLIVLACLACARPRFAPALPGVGSFRAMTIKFNFNGPQGRQNGKVYLRFDERNAKFMFFDPLNQVALELDVAGETALLLRPGRKIFWRGDFSFLLDRLWGMDLRLEELKRLVLEGTVPEGRIAENGMTIDLEPGPGNGPPRVIDIRRDDSRLILKIINSETRPGQVVMIAPGPSHEAAGLEEVLGDD